MDFFKYYFNEDEWTIYLIDDDDNVISEEHVAAEVKFAEKEILVRKNQINYRTISHELWHVYFKYCYLEDTGEMVLSDIEEVCASLFEDKGERILTKAKDIEKKLIELRDKNVE